MHVDLNLLIALDALLEENSVAGAADRLRLSHPAMSRTLGRIRRATGDDILVRSGRTMTPTPRALELRDETRELVRRATAVLTPAQTLHLDTLDRVFTIRGHDALAGALALPLTTAIGSSAPNVRIRLLAEPSADVADLARGHTDLEIGATSPARPEIAAKTIGTDHMVTVFRAGHPLAEAELSAELFAAAGHVTVSRRGRLHGAVDEALAERGLHRQVVAALPTTSAALDLVAATDLLTVVAEQVCRPLRTRLGLHSRRPPFDLPPVPVILTWHHRNDTDPAHAWLRAQVRSALRGILGSSASGALSSTAAASTML
jgi:DNA-binding transcriptional LysR family regulator